MGSKESKESSKSKLSPRSNTKPQHTLMPSTPSTTFTNPKFTPMGTQWSIIWANVKLRPNPRLKPRLMLNSTTTLLTETTNNILNHSTLPTTVIPLLTTSLHTLPTLLDIPTALTPTRSTALIPIKSTTSLPCPSDT